MCLRRDTKPPCRIDVYSDWLDVVFITHGKSNDSQLEICTVICCLHNCHGVDTYTLNSGGGSLQSLIALATMIMDDKCFWIERAIQNITERLLRVLCKTWYNLKMVLTKPVSLFWLYSMFIIMHAADSHQKIPERLRATYASTYALLC